MFCFVQFLDFFNIGKLCKYNWSCNFFSVMAQVDTWRQFCKPEKKDVSSVSAPAIFCLQELESDLSVWMWSESCQYAPVVPKSSTEQQTCNYSVSLVNCSVCFRVIWWSILFSVASFLLHPYFICCTYLYILFAFDDTLKAFWFCFVFSLVSCTSSFLVCCLFLTFAPVVILCCLTQFPLHSIVIWEKCLQFL